VLKAVDAGINGSRVARLRDAYGKTSSRSRNTRALPNLAALLVAHQDATDEDMPAAKRGGAAG